MTAARQLSLDLPAPFTPAGEVTWRSHLSGQWCCQRRVGLAMVLTSADTPEQAEQEAEQRVREIRESWGLEVKT